MQWQPLRFLPSCLNCLHSAGMLAYLGMTKSSQTALSDRSIYVISISYLPVTHP